MNEFYKGKNIFLIFFTGFFIWNITSTYWLSYATIFGYLFACTVNSFMMTIVFYLFRKVKIKTNEKLGFIFLITIWICYEKLHLAWDFSWPWLIFGNVFSENTWIIQWYEYTGVFGGTLWVLVTNILLVSNTVNSNYKISKKCHNKLLALSSSRLEPISYNDIDKRLLGKLILSNPGKNKKITPGSHQKSLNNLEKAAKKYLKNV